MSKSAFIVLEGIDGSGTTVQAKLLHEFLISQDINSYLTAEPSKGPIGKFIREILGGEVHSHFNQMNPEQLKVILGLLFTADRADHVWSELTPKWNDGLVTVCDRYALSTFAYEFGILSDKEWIEKIGRALPIPDLTFYLRLSAEEAFDRLKKRWEEKGDGGASPEIFEKLELQKRISSHYDTFCQIYQHRHNIVTIDASASIETVAGQIQAEVTYHLLRAR